MSLWSRIRGQQLDEDDLRQEIESHLAIAADDRVAQGTERRTAELASLKDFGNVALTQAAVREVWIPHWLEYLFDVGRDARLALRLLARSPAFSLTVIAVLALGISLNATVFTLLKSLALAPLGGVERSIDLTVVLNEAAGGRRSGLSYPDYKYVREHFDAFSGLSAAALVNANLGSGARAEHVVSELVSGNYFELLGVRAQLGRTLNAQDEVAPGQHPVAVISDTLWRRSFNADPGIVGQTIKLNTFPLTVVGVADSSFHGTIVSFDVEVFVPLMMAPQIDREIVGNPNDYLSDANTHFLMVLGRLRPGVSRREAAAQAALMSQQLDDDNRVDAVAEYLVVLPIWRSPYGAQTYLLPTVSVLLVMGGLLLMVACANVAGLVLARGVARRGEIALRLALGASRLRVVRLLLVENVILALPAAIIAALLLPRVIPWLLSGIAAASPVRVFLNLSVDRMVLAFSILTAMVSALALGLFPALQSSRVQLQSTINENLSPRGASRSRFRSALVVAQVAVSLFLLIGASLVTRSLDAARNADAGFDPYNVVSARVDLTANNYDKTRGLAFYEQLLERLRADNGTESATLSANAPLGLVDGDGRLIDVEGHAAGKDEDRNFMTNVVAPDYFRAFKIGLLAGREFLRADDDSALRVAIVNETMARRFWNTPAGALGQRIRVSSGEWRTVVGVARDIKYSRLTEGPRSYVYLPFYQSYEPMMLIYARSTIGTAALTERLRTHISAIDPELPILGSRTLREQTQASLAFLMLAAAMLFIFGLAGMALAAMGIYGLVAYTVRQSTHEIGIRMALGAHGAAVVSTFLRRGLRLGAIGAIAGAAVALATTQFMTSVLYGISATNAGAFAAGGALVVSIVVVATLIPAWRATRTNVLTALRHQ